MYLALLRAHLLICFLSCRQVLRLHVPRVGTMTHGDALSHALHAPGAVAW